MSVRFPDDLIVTVLDPISCHHRRMQHKLYQDFRYVSTQYATIVVHDGYVTDFASVPWFLWRVMPPNGPWTKAAVVHDYMCDRPQLWSRKEANLVFLEAMRDLDVCLFHRAVGFTGVELYRLTWMSVRTFFRKLRKK